MADISRLNHTVLFISLAGFLVILGVIIWISGSITKPLRLLSRATEQIGSGDLDVEIPPVKSRDEVGKLADSFNYMKTSLKKYIKELTETTAAKEKIESELKIAHDIQMGMLHKIFPPFPERSEFDIYAMLDPARAVGGDLYDFFFMDEDHLCFTVGDVSDKGVPAALYMTIVMTLIRTKASLALTADAVLSQVNQDISKDNPSAMFVTLFLGILNIRTGELQYANGGHNPPYLIRASGDLEPLETTHGMALGIDEDFSYQSKTIVLENGESIFLYTDGVTEAMNEKEEMFTEQRMEKELAVLKESPVEGVINGMLEKIEAFSEGMEQHDDITMLILRFYGG
jgi:sigma-B regulation protein RsbU (phosphoserine phosphatase)